MGINEKILKKGLKINGSYLAVFIAATLFVYFHWQSQWSYWMPTVFTVLSTLSLSIQFFSKKYFANQS